MSIPRKKPSKCRVRELYYIKGGQHGPKRTINESKMHFQHQSEQKQTSIAPGEVARSHLNRRPLHIRWIIITPERDKQPETPSPAAPDAGYEEITAGAAATRRELKKKTKTHSAFFWMMPSLIVCDGSQQGRQSGARNHNTLVVTSGFFFFYMREERRIRGIHTQVEELSGRSCFQIFWGKFMSSLLNVFPPPLSWSHFY